MFTFQQPTSNTNAPREFQPIKPGKYEGRITKAEVGKTKAGHKTIKLRLKLEGHPGFHFVDLNMEHEKTKAISLQTISSILFGALKTPPSSLATLESICAFITDLPVAVTIKEKAGKDGEMRPQTYFNDCKMKLETKLASQESVGNFRDW